MSDQIVGLINPAMSLIFAAGALILWMRDRTNTYLLGFAVAPLAIGMTMAIHHYNPHPEAMVPRIAVHVCSILASVSIAWAACTRVGRRTPWRAWLYGAGTTAVLNAFAVSYDSFMASYFIINSMCGIVFVTAAQLLAQVRSRAIADRVMVWLFALIAAQFFVRPAVVTILEGTLTAAEYRNSVGYAILTVAAAILTLLLAVSVLSAVLSDQIRDMQVRSQSDVLTGLPLRRAFEEFVAEKLVSHEDDDTPISLIIADIDHFKQVNDLWGHQAGDRALANFGSLIGKTIRRTDQAGRIGGEEFCILVWDCTEQQALRMAERMRVSFAGLVHEGISADVRLTASFGVTRFDRGEGYARAFSRADRALYAAKESGRNRCVLAGQRRGAVEVADAADQTTGFASAA